MICLLVHRWLNRVALFSQSPIAVWAVCTFFPEIPHWLINLLHLGHELQEQKSSCSQGMTPPCSFPLCPVSCLAWSRTSLNAVPLRDILNDRRTTAASQIIQRVAQTLSCFIQIFWVLVGDTLPRIPTTSTYPKLLLVGSPVARALRLMK